MDTHTHTDTHVPEASLGGYGFLLGLTLKLEKLSNSLLLFT